MAFDLATAAPVTGGGFDLGTAKPVAAADREARIAAQMAADRKLYDPTNGMSFADRFNAGAGKAFADLGRGIGQRLGLVSDADVAESRQLDAPLMKTGAAKAGNIGANVTMLAPASLIPGAATVPGAAVIGGIAGALQPSVGATEPALNTALGALGGAAGQKLANVAAGSVATQQADAALKTAQAAQKAGAATKASAAGYVVPPEDLGGGALTRVLSGIGGKVKTAQVASERNQGVTNELARKTLGLPAGSAMDTNALGAMRQQAGQAYDAVKNTGVITADNAYTTALDNIAKQYTAASQAFPGAVKSEIPDLVSALKQPNFSADGAVEMTKVLRAGADGAFAKGDKGTGKAMREAADALESMMERHLQGKGMPDAMKALQDARQTIARTYTVQKALNPSTGDVSAPVLANMLSKGKPLGPELTTAAEAAQAFPKAMQMLKETPKSISPLDVAFAVSHAAGGHALNLLSIGARPAARSIMLSGPAQRSAVNAMGVPQAVNPLMQALSQEPLTLPMGVLGANRLAAYLSQQ